ncbi:hypothetical protein AVEN_224709-1 [Araneus ventricosus]|uniref:Uncharacterized protein n=1 Tax=Araneus ventricosus TaxID=182803 RepID=A0A4Y2ESU0_ARAVE|nr:hypothetical protein AVEN_224709-1 [Araneus ventricosus]
MWELYGIPQGVFVETATNPNTLFFHTVMTGQTSAVNSVQSINGLWKETTHDVHLMMRSDVTVRCKITSLIQTCTESYGDPSRT